LEKEIFTRNNIYIYIFIVAVACIIISVIDQTYLYIIEILVLFTLVLITGLYAERTLRIAKASEKQASEIKEQRLDMVLPILDILWDPASHPQESHQSGDWSQGFDCVLRNVGLGPASDVWAYLIIEDTNARPMSMKTLEPREQTEIAKFAALFHMEGYRGIIVHYKDAHNRWFSSERRIEWDEESQLFIFGQLTINRIPPEVIEIARRRAIDVTSGAILNEQEGD